MKPEQLAEVFKALTFEEREKFLQALGEIAEPVLRNLWYIHTDKDLPCG